MENYNYSRSKRERFVLKSAAAKTSLLSVVGDVMIRVRALHVFYITTEYFMKSVINFSVRFIFGARWWWRDGVLVCAFPSCVSVFVFVCQWPQRKLPDDLLRSRSHHFRVQQQFLFALDFCSIAFSRVHHELWQKVETTDDFQFQFDVLISSILAKLDFTHFSGSYENVFSVHAEARNYSTLKRGVEI